MIVIRHTQGNDELARVYVGELGDKSLIEFVESVQPPHPLEEKWVLIVSTLKGCPVGCAMCDAGGHFRGRLTAGEILEQIDLMIRRRFPDGRVPVRKLKIQFARMGDPAFNDAVPEVLRRLPALYNAPGLMPSISTIAPAGRERFFEELLTVKRQHYSDGRFQLQFSLHTSDEQARRRLIPARTWSFAQMADYSRLFFERGDRKITLNFAAPKGFPLDPAELRRVFSPDIFLIKITPINPTNASYASGLESLIDPNEPEAARALCRRFEEVGYKTILSIGELEENRIGSNCGMYVVGVRQECACAEQALDVTP
ncbi:MAG: radical SAM protein [Myxococcales bacterium]|nr:MAG: radical SAM protein [Myxococcales bacterium]